MRRPHRAPQQPQIAHLTLAVLLTYLAVALTHTATTESERMLSCGLSTSVQRTQG